MADYLQINTALKEADGTGKTGYVIATLLSRVVLAGGGTVLPFRLKFALLAGVAQQPAGGAVMQLPVTEDANPAGVGIQLSHLDDQNRLTPIGEIVVPRNDGTPIDLESILPVGSLGSLA